MRRAAALAPRPPELPAALQATSLTSLAHDVTCAEIEVADAILSGQHARGLALQAVKLVRVDLSASHLDHCRIADGQLDSCNLANVHGRRGEFTRLAIVTSRLTGIDLTESTLRDVAISDCRVDLASLGFSRLERVTFENCVLSQTDFLEAQLESVRFHGCDLTRADFRGARLRHCEFRGGDLSGLQGIESLRGAAMEWAAIVDMAGTWASALGIEVLDAE